MIGQFLRLCLLGGVALVKRAYIAQGRPDGEQVFEYVVAKVW